MKPREWKKWGGVPGQQGSTYWRGPDANQRHDQLEIARRRNSESDSRYLEPRSIPYHQVYRRACTQYWLTVTLHSLLLFSSLVVLLAFIIVPKPRTSSHHLVSPPVVPRPEPSIVPTRWYCILDVSFLLLSTRLLLMIPWTQPTALETYNHLFLFLP